MNPILKEAIYYVIAIDDVDDYDDGDSTIESLDNAEWWMLQSIDDHDVHPCCIQ